MTPSDSIDHAVRLAVQVHQREQKQKRKGTDDPYIIHPLTVGLLLAAAGANEHVVIAGILHDTIEDSKEPYKVTRAILAEGFGEKVAALVDDVTEQNRSLPWQERKQRALEHIANFSEDSVFLKSGDVLANARDVLTDYGLEGDQVFERFNARKSQILNHYLRVIPALLERWPENPLAGDLERVSRQLQAIQSKDS